MYLEINELVNRKYDKITLTIKHFRNHKIFIKKIYFKKIYLKKIQKVTFDTKWLKFSKILPKVRIFLISIENLLINLVKHNTSIILHRYIFYLCLFYIYT